jgi:hypothetical protein
MYVLVRLHLPNTWEMVGVYNSWWEATVAQSRYGGPLTYVWTSEEYRRAKGVRP